MNRPQFDAANELLRHGLALRQLAAELVSDANVADDAVQEVWLAALQRPPRHQDALGGWFVKALQNVLRMWRRKERRRDRHEAAAMVGRDGVDRGESVAREERGRQLLTAVESLDAPYREVVWQRYFEGKAPREIAASSGVLLPTVKSRLQRGLAILRERLAAGADGGDWRCAFAAAFGLRENAAVASVAAMTGGGVLVATWTKALLAVAAVVVAAMLWWPRGAVAGPAVAAHESHAAAVAQRVETGAQATTSEVAKELEVERSEAPMPPRVDPRLASIRGRCADEQGRAIAGGHVSLRGRMNTRRAESWLRDHPQPEWADPPLQITAADGSFLFTFVPLPPHEYHMDIIATGFASMRGRWLSIDPGADIALGDVVMEPGIEIRGRVVDARGAPCPEALWTVQRDKTAPAADGLPIKAETSHGGRCRPDGTFSTDHRFASGDYVIRVYDGLRKAEKKMRFVRERPLAEIVLELPDCTNPTISGRIVDEQGSAVAGVRIEVAKQPHGTSTARDGTFTLQRQPEDEGASVALVVQAEGFDTLTTDPIAWGARDVELRLRGCANLVITVVDEHDDPVPDYSVRCAPLRGTGRLGTSSQDYRVRARGPFPEGVANVPGVSGGTWRLVVEFPAATGLPMVVADIDIPESGLRHVVQARSAGQRPLRVAFADGTPVVGTRVQLVDRLGQPPSPASSVMETSPWLNNFSSRHAALVVFEGFTGADGRLTLRGPRDRPLGLRVLGPGHAPVEQDPVSLPDNAELEVVVTRGARLVGRIVPAGALKELARLDTYERTRRRGPWLRLRPASGQNNARTSTASGSVDAYRVELAEDGGFSFDGLPAGLWTVVVEYMRSFASGASSESTDVTTVALVDGEETRRDIDLSALLPGELDALVLWNGVPFANATVRIEATYHDVNGQWRASSSFSVPTDASGRFRRTDSPGQFAIRLWSGPDGGEVPRLRAPVVAKVVASGTTPQVFIVDSGTVHLVVQDNDGRPLEGAIVFVKDSDVVFQPSDAQGKTKAEVAAGAVMLRVLPKTMQSAEIRQRREAEGRMQPILDSFAEHWIELGKVVVGAGQTVTHEVRVPPAFEK